MDSVERSKPLPFSSIENMPRIFQTAYGRPLESRFEMPNTPRPSSFKEPLDELKRDLEEIKPSTTSEVVGRILGFLSGVVGFAIGAAISGVLIVASFGLILCEEKGRKAVEWLLKTPTLSFAKATLNFIKEMSVQSQQMSAIKKSWLLQGDLKTVKDADAQVRSSFRADLEGTKKTFQKHYKDLSKKVGEISTNDVERAFTGKRKTQKLLDVLKNKYMDKPTKLAEKATRREPQIHEKNLKELTKEFENLLKQEQLFPQCITTLAA